MKTPPWSLSLAVAGALAVGAVAARPTLADEPSPLASAPLTEAEQARVQTLIQNLGSEDFGVRQSATKELIGLGERARPALEKARDSQVPEVRHRADQILRSLDGRNRETPFPGTRPGTVVVKPGKGEPQSGGTIFLGPWTAGQGWAGGGQGFGEEEVERWMNEFRERWGQGHTFGAFPGMAVFGRPAKRHFKADGADLRVQSDGVRLAVTEKLADGVSVTHVYEAKTLDAILAAKPDLRSHAGVASVLDQRKKAEEESKAPPAQGMPPFSFHSSSQGLSIESSPGRVKVTVTEPGPDGKPESKTYESTDLETLKREHPELADRLGGIRFDFGTSGGGGGSAGTGGLGGLRWEPARPDAPSSDGLTGPFGIGLRAAPDGRGVSVIAVRAGSDASNLGLRSGDVILKINGTAVTFDEGPTSARELIRAAKGAMTFEIVRDGATILLQR